MKSLNQIRDELAKKYSTKERNYNHTRIMEPMIKYAEHDYKKGFSTATDLVFDRIVEALKSQEASEFLIGYNRTARWLVDNKKRILKGEL